MLKDWKLESTLSRVVNPLPATTNLDEILDKHLNNFKSFSRGRRGSNPPLDIVDDEWWALGQRHGLATPLLGFFSLCCSVLCFQ
ncbi:hypothetical protein BS614_28375 [Paenibacillus xylanexedens]|uniref:FRG domain-containing protein n=1 Tax=Paenibacillus xylanexedens TaxID=528191 RepID=UPI0009387649|nr:hypothetical protein BS614_28375 [Paenibacillus xylanexedens]